MSHSSTLIADDIHAYLKQHETKELLRFITCGSVDDGKSTLIGRLLHDSQLIYDDQLAALERDSARHGTTGDDIDFALLVDGLQAEREQGITIDVAYRFFSTEKRKFIIADTPGHEQYTRNMATGASTAALAVILVDARHGVLTQTRRHSFITTLLGIRQLVVAINKMDLVDYSERQYQHICDEYRAFAAHLPLQPDIQFVPLSALKGDNVTSHSERTPWYTGPSLMQILENAPQQTGRSFGELRFPVQYVNRPSHHFRGFCGTIAAGSMQVGDDIMVLPARTTSRIQRIIGPDGDQQRASADQPVTICLADEIDISRGDLIVHPKQSPAQSASIDADIVWMDQTPLLPGKQYLFKIGPRSIAGHIAQIEYSVDVNSLERQSCDQLELNSIARCRIDLETPIPLDPYDQSPLTGSGILIDRLSNATSGALMVRQIPRSATNIHWHPQRITKELRAGQKHQRPGTLWFTGLSGAGKSTIANALEQRLFQLGHHSYLLDGDNIRHGLNQDLGFTDSDRHENIRRIAETCKLFVDAGLIVLSAFISPFREDRQQVRNLLGPGEFIEIHIDAPIETCEARDPKGLYRKARAGEIANFTGISSAYETPIAPELHLRSDQLDVDQSVEVILDYLRQQHILHQ